MTEQREIDIDQVMEDGSRIREALREAVAEALLLHKKLGYPIVVSRGDEIVWIPPEEIQIPEPSSS